MKRRSVLIVFLVGLVLGACLHRAPTPPGGLPGFVVLEAQTLPIAKTFAWDANPASQNVTNYTVTLDGVVVGNPAGTTQPVTFTTLGPHVITLTATNLWGTSPASTLNVLVQAPTAPQNGRLQ